MINIFSHSEIMSYRNRFNYKNRFNRLRKNIVSISDIKNNNEITTRKEFCVKSIHDFNEITCLMDVLNDTYKRDSMQILEKLEEINKDDTVKLSLPDMESTKLVLKYLIEKL